MIISRLTSCLLVPLLGATPALACSKGTLGAPLGDSVSYFTGIGTADTLLAGPGTVGFDRRPGTPAGYSIYGQLVRVNRIGGRTAARLPSGIREVVVVPWGYDPACRTLSWKGSAQWVPVGTRGFFVATLRDADHWVGGRPTFDLHNPWNMPYTGTERIREMSRNDPVSALLSIDDVFDLYEALPSAAEAEARGLEALASLRAWVTANPELAARPPADRLVSMVLGAIAHAELKETDHPVLGTWRFTLSVGGDSAHTFYARTDSHPTTGWSPSRRPYDRNPGEIRIDPPEGYAFLATLSDRADELPEEMVSRRDHVQSYLYALAEPEPEADGTTAWRGNVDPSLLAAAAQNDPAVQRAAEEARERFRERYRQGLADELDGRFTRDADGTLRFTQTVPLSDGEDLVLTGEQISRTVVRIPW